MCEGGAPHVAGGGAVVGGGEGSQVGAAILDAEEGWDTSNCVDVDTDDGTRLGGSTEGVDTTDTVEG